MAENRGRMSDTLQMSTTCEDHGKEQGIPPSTLQADPDSDKSKLTKDTTVGLVDESGSVIECAVCLQPYKYPVELECKHIFCFLCVKGAAHRSKRCALCRQEISTDFFSNPKLVRQEDLEMTVRFDNQYQWFYQGGNGWWQYDDRTSQELESRHKKGDKVFELLIAGFLYIIDLENMYQVRRNDRSRKRKIRRDLVSIPGVKGVAGLKYNSKSPSTDRPVGDGNEQKVQSSQTTANSVPNQTLTTPTQPSTSDGGMDDHLTVPYLPNNTSQTPNTPVDSPPSSLHSSQDLSVQFQNMDLGNNNLPGDGVSPVDTDTSSESQSSASSDILNIVHDDS